MTFFIFSMSVEVAKCACINCLLIRFHKVNLRIILVYLRHIGFPATCATWSLHNTKKGKLASLNLNHFISFVKSYLDCIQRMMEKQYVYTLILFWGQCESIQIWPQEECKNLNENYITAQDHALGHLFYSDQSKALSS